MTVPIGGVSTRSMVNRVPYLPLLSWAAMQLFSIHKLCKIGRERPGYPPPKAPDLFSAYAGGFIHRDQ